MKKHVARTLTVIVAGALALRAGGPSAQVPARPDWPLAFASPDARLADAFAWAKRQATDYVFEGDRVGDWYEAALPGREAFCMRDVSHQAMGAHALGLQRHTRTMLRRFAENITDARDWCSLWEIDRHNQPAHADYRNDNDFWYNLPANFDVLDASYRMFLWTGDPEYVGDPVFLQFYQRTVTDYVERWGLGPDTIMKRPRLMNRRGQADPDAKFTEARGIPGYNEETTDFVVGLDLLATQYAGYAAYARIQEARGDLGSARLWLKKAAEVKAFVNRAWWDEKTNAFFDRLTTDYRLAPRSNSFWNIAELYWPVAADGPHAKAAVTRLVEQIKRSPSAPVEEQSHHAEVLYRYGVPEVAYQQMLDLARDNRSRREYPEVSFSIIGAIVTGLMGVSVDPVAPGREEELLDYFAGRFVMTLPQLTGQTAWAELRHLPVRGNDISVRHEGQAASVFTNNRGPAVVWRAAFPGAFDTLVVNGDPVKARRETRPVDHVVSWVRVVVGAGNSARVEVPRAAPLQRATRR